jgi:hypothetical protein
MKELAFLLMQNTIIIVGIQIQANKQDIIYTHGTG